ncbi:ribosome maturation factor RimM [Oscillochloris sp. ZM17-4]|uniref:ribosome maturation factor RimM n=1 Tax=Oscillochloris sp. ZM17-4 TaxID=2866714 RepID=UPI001C7373E5|nr:ribosome maturation factor RimM [Oscillochloris sp. ZM17-4]MBX0331231.1 ribosome maturation factor RimM [Oscillochloris sp. ZM17-4]
MTTTESPDDLLLIGVIAGPFGIKGLVKMKSFTDQPDYLRRRLRQIFVGKKLAPYTLTKLHEHKPGVLLLTLSGLEKREDVDELRGSEVYIRQSDAAPLGEDEYYIHDLIGMQVSTVDGQEIGPVREVIETGVHEVLVVTRAGQGDALIPVVREFIAEFDIPGRRVVVRPIEGLLS